MKKFLSLVLALVMTMSLVTVGAGAADFTDEDSITYEEAVEVMTALGVVGGYADGSFGPKGTLTRGAAAKIICNLILGTTTADALVADAAPYSDVPVDNVFAGYIAYLAKAGVIGGYADGTFRPAATLTGYAFMKMLLGVIGLDASIEGYTGANWSIAVAKRALSEGVDLTDGLVGEFNGTKAVTREEACLYAFNAIKAGKFSYSNKSTIVVGNVSVSNTSEASQAEVYKNEEGDLVNAYYQDVFSKLERATLKNGDDFGRPAHKWLYDDDKVGTYTDKPVATFEGKTSEKDVYLALDGEDGKVEVKEIYEDGVEHDGVTYKKSVTNNAPYFGYGVKVEVYELTDAKGNDYYRLVAIRDYLAKVTAVNKADEDEDEDRSVDIEIYTEDSRFDGLTANYETEDFAKKDWIIVNIAIDDDGDAEVKSAVKAEKLENQAVTAYKVGGMDKASVTFGGEKYSYSQNFDGKIDAQTYEMKDGDSYTFYLDSYGNVIMVEEYEVTSTEYYRVSDKSEDSDSDAFGDDEYYTYKVVGMDGKSQVVKMMVEDNEDIKATQIVTMSDDDDNVGYVVLKAVKAYNASEPETAGVKSSSDAVKSIDKKSATLGGLKVDNDTVFVIEYKAGKYKAVTGLKNMDSYTGITGTYPTAVMKDGVAVVMFLNTKGGTASTDTDDLVYIVSTDADISYDAANKCYINEYKAVVDGEMKSVMVHEDSKSTIGKGLYAITETKDGYALTLEEKTDKGYAKEEMTNYEASFKSGILTLEKKAYVVADDAVVYMVDKNNKLTVTDAEALDGTLTGTAYVVMKAADDAIVTAVYFKGSAK